ncbi:MAG: VWA domain-containing protein [Deltaproteobacteria bacterium]|nr:VWA domain-containing protein [Deltaproteobacteria bacterium]
MKGAHYKPTFFTILCLAIFLLSGFFLYACSGGGGGNSLAIQLQGTTVAPNIVKLNFTVETTSGEPVADLAVGTAGTFTVTDDAKALVNTEASYVVYQEPKDYSLYTIVMVDLSGSVAANDALMNDIKTSLKAFINPMLTNGQMVAIYVFDSGIRMIADFTDDNTVLEGTIDNLADYARTGTSSNMYGAFIDGLNLLDGAVNDDDAPYVAGSLVVFTDGMDTTGRFTYEETLSRVQNTSHSVFLILHADPGIKEAGKLEALAPAYYAVMDTVDINAVGTQFETIETNLKNKASKFYVLEYATPKRDNDPATVHTLDVQFTHGEKQKGKMSYSYNAYYFTEGGYIQVEDKKLSLYDADGDGYYSVDGIMHDCDDTNIAIWEGCASD